MTIPPEEGFMHVFVGEEDRQRALALVPRVHREIALGNQGLGFTPGIEVCSAIRRQVSRDQGLRSKSPEGRGSEDFSSERPKGKEVSVLQPVRPNPSFEARPNGKTPGPGHGYGVHFPWPGPGVLPSVPPQLER